jgi:dihydroorotase
MPDVISSDVHILCEHGSAFDLLHSMNKLFGLGMPLEEVIAAATARPAAALRRTDIGTLAKGAAGDAALFEMADGSFDYVDVLGERMSAGRRLELRHIVKGGRLWHSAEGGPGGH